VSLLLLLQLNEQIELNEMPQDIKLWKTTLTPLVQCHYKDYKEIIQFIIASVPGGNFEAYTAVIF